MKTIHYALAVLATKQAWFDIETIVKESEKLGWQSYASCKCNAMMQAIYLFHRKNPELILVRLGKAGLAADGVLRNLVNVGRKLAINEIISDPSNVQNDGFVAAAE